MNINRIILLLFLSIYLGTIGGARADSDSRKYVDVTTEYLSNAGFEAGSLDGWTCKISDNSYLSGKDGVSSDAKYSGEYGANMKASDGTYRYLYRTITLSAGTYRLSVMVNGVPHTATTDNATDKLTKFFVSYDNKDQYIVPYTKDGWQCLSASFTITEQKEVRIGIWCGNAKDYWYYADDFKVEKYFESWPNFSSIISNYDFEETDDTKLGWTSTFQTESNYVASEEKFHHQSKKTDGGQSGSQYQGNIIIEDAPNHHYQLYGQEKVMNGKIYQVVTGLPVGKYRIKVAGGMEIFNNDNATATLYVHKVDASGNAIDGLSWNEVISSKGKDRVGWYSCDFESQSETDRFEIGISVESSEIGHCLDLDNFGIYALSTVTLKASKVRWGTFVCPFDVELTDENLTAYDAESVVANENKLNLTNGRKTIEANTPVILYSSDPNGISEATFSGIFEEATNDLKSGLLTGVLDATIDAPKDSYVLQNHSGVIGFYRVVDVIPHVTPYHAYLTIPANSSTGAKALYFDTSSVTGIEKVEVEDNAGKTVRAYYTIGGTRISTPQKGVNIVQFTDGSTKKMILK